MKNVIKIFLVVVTLLSVVSTSTNQSVQAATADKGRTEHPHPYYKDTWNYGVRASGLAYSHYYLDAPVRLGSGATIEGPYGWNRVYRQADYGWARAERQKNWNWWAAFAYYSWYNF